MFYSPTPNSFFFFTNEDSLLAFVYQMSIMIKKCIGIVKYYFVVLVLFHVVVRLDFIEIADNVFTFQTIRAGF